MVSQIVLEAENMNVRQSYKIGYGRYLAGQDKCPIIDLLHPTWEALGEHLVTAKGTLKTAINSGLLESLSEAKKTAPDYPMPEEARIAQANGFSDLAKFLLDPLETTMNLELSKNGRMAVHRLIDNKMGYGKLYHQSE
jgi:hypothetical protein